MRLKAVMYGGGNIGRGFIGPVFRQSGYEVTFIDVAEQVVEGLKTRGQYPVRILAGGGHEDIVVDGVTAVNANDTEQVANAIAEADIMATAVGVNVLKHIVPNIAAGIRRRFATTDKPLNIIICENLLDADKILCSMLKAQLSEQEYALFDERIGLVEASIGRMVPVQTDDMRGDDPLRVCVERYGWLPVDKDAFVDEIPDIKGLVPYAPFGYFIKRKLFIHNMGHAMCAYLGLYTGQEYIWQAIDQPDILVLVKNAMLESARALSAEYDIPLEKLLSHIDDLLLRFRNRALGDTCARVGGDTVRKLSPNDRLIGAAKACAAQGILPRHIMVGAAAALHRHLLLTGQAQEMQNTAEVLHSVAGLEEDTDCTKAILEYYALFRTGTNPGILRNMVADAGETDAAQVV